MSIVAVHGPNTFGSKSIVANTTGSAYAIVNPANGLIWTFYAKDQSQPAANYDWAYTGAAGTPPSPIADTKSPVVTLPAGAHTVTLTLNGVAQGTFTITAVAGVAPRMGAEEEAEVSLLAEGRGAPEPAELTGPSGDGDTEVDVGYDPAAHTVADVEAFANEHPDQARDLYDAEVAGKNRATLVSFLEGMMPFDPGEYSVADVIAYAEENPDEVEEIMEAEREGKARVTLLTHLESLVNGD